MRPETTAAGRRRPLDRRQVERRELIARRLLPAIERLLETETYTELSIEELAAEAGVSRSSFYNYFEDKGDLLRMLTTDVMNAIVGSIRLWWMLPADASKEQLREAFEHIFDTYTPHAALMVAVAESAAHDPGVREEFLAFMELGVNGVADNIRAGQQAGVFREHLDADRAAQWLTWMFERGLSKLAQSEEGQDPERVVVALTDVVWKGLR